ncbi:MAG: nuclear transport factor 2 family protein [Thermodesulfobacteriota bacterium]
MHTSMHRAVRIMYGHGGLKKISSAMLGASLSKVYGNGSVAIAIAILLIAGVMLLPVQAHSPKASKEDILKIEQAWADAVFKGDVEALEKILADNISYIHGTGLVETKAQFIEQLKSGNRKFLAPIVAEEVNVRTFGDTAIVTGKFVLKVFSRGKEITGVNRFTHVFAKVGKEWQLVAHQATLLPAEK